MQLAELCENTRRGARGLILPVATEIGSPNESELLARDRPPSSTELDLRPREVALDGGFAPAPSPSTCPTPTDCSSPAASRRLQRRPTAAWPSSASAPKAASATSNAATACADRA